MLFASGKGGDIQWFDYRPSFNQEIVRVEWDADTMMVAIPSEVAGFLTNGNYARPMTPVEAKEYNSRIEPEKSKEVVEDKQELPQPRRANRGD